MLKLGKLLDLVGDMDDDIEIRVSVSNGSLEIKSLEYVLDNNKTINLLDNNKTINLKVELDDFLELSKLLENNNGRL